VMTAAAIVGKRVVRSPPFLPLCGAPHNGNYAERTIMRSALLPDLRRSLLSTA
jgi:hypothetical protein